MSQSEKSQYYKALKEAGVTFDKHYREYNTEELKAAHDKLFESMPPAEEAPPASWATPEPPAAKPSGKPQPPAPPVSSSPKDNEMPGERLNSNSEMEPIRTDEQGRVWYQEEVRKPAYPKPRGRRVLRYEDTGTKTAQVQVGNYVETFEIPGDEVARSAEVKITLPSYQVGIYKDRRFPFKIHTYDGRQGFDLFEVQNYYGGSELVPAECKRVYVENVLCYDIRTVVRAIQTEYRQQQLAGRI